MEPPLPAQPPALVDAGAIRPRKEPVRVSAQQSALLLRSWTKYAAHRWSPKKSFNARHGILKLEPFKVPPINIGHVTRSLNSFKADVDLALQLGAKFDDATTDAINSLASYPLSSMIRLLDRVYTISSIGDTKFFDEEKPGGAETKYRGLPGNLHAFLKRMHKHHKAGTVPKSDDEYADDVAVNFFIRLLHGYQLLGNL